MSETRSSWPVAIAAVAMFGLSAVVSAWGYTQWANRLADYPLWQSAKSQVETELMGAERFVESAQTLARGQLDLSAWHGCNEVAYAEPLPLESVRFRALLEEQAHLTVLLEDEDGPAMGVRFSASAFHPPATLHVEPSGRFLQRKESEALRLVPGRWHALEVRVEKNRLHCFVDGEKLRSIDHRLPGQLRLAFRGGVRRALLDDVRIASAGVPDIVEDFTGFVRFPDHFAWALAMHFGLLVGSFAVFRVIAAHRRDAYGMLLAMGICLFVATGVLVAAYYVVLSRLYPRADQFTGERELIEGFVEDKMAHYAEVLDDPDWQDVPLLLFLGTSQTFGQGASTYNARFTSLLEPRLLEHVGGVRVLCVNGGIPAADSATLLEMYEDFWGRWDMAGVFVILGANDKDPETLRENLRRMAAIAKERGDPLVLVLEALNPESHPERLPTHAAIAAVGEELHLPVIDAHHILRSKADKGFLWWDLVHLTDYGHQLLSDTLLPAALPIMRASGGDDDSQEAPAGAPYRKSSKVLNSES